MPKGEKGAKHDWPSISEVNRWMAGEWSPFDQAQGRTNQGRRQGRQGQRRAPRPINDQDGPGLSPNAERLLFHMAGAAAAAAVTWLLDKAST